MVISALTALQISYKVITIYNHSSFIFRTMTRLIPIKINRCLTHSLGTNLRTKETFVPHVEGENIIWCETHLSYISFVKEAWSGFSWVSGAEPDKGDEGTGQAALVTGCCDIWLVYRPVHLLPSIIPDMRWLMMVSHHLLYLILHFLLHYPIKTLR